jgi:cell division protease FtsH
VIRLSKPDTTRRRRLSRRFLVYAVAFIATGLLVWSPWNHSAKPTVTSLSTVQRMIATHEVRTATLFGKQDRIDVTLKDGTMYAATYLGGYSTQLSEQLTKAGAKFTNVLDDRGWLSQNFGTLVFFGIWAFAAIGIAGGPILGLFKGGRSGGLMEGILGSTDFKAERPEERFKDVIGADEAIADLRDLVAFLKNPDAYKGVNIPRGYLFYGPTGTGKTMLSRALAGEADVNFYALSGAGLTSMWGGGSTQKIDRFFARVKKEVKPDQPVVVFIDEFDGLASARAGATGSDRDSNNSVGHLLDRIVDFFAYFERGVIVAASNRKDAIDDAALRPGRIGVHIAMPNPDRKARATILQNNCKDLRVEGVDFILTAHLTAGMSGAAVANIPGIAALLARRRDADNPVITSRDIEEAAMELTLGKLRIGAYVTDEDRHDTGVHESGHAVVAAVSPFHQLLVVTTIPIGPSGGSTWQTPGDREYDTLETQRWRIAILLGGREAELLDLQHSTSGTTHDIDVATRLAREVVCRWGAFDEFLGAIDMDVWEDHPRAAEIAAKVDEFLVEASRLARTTLEEHRALRLELQQRLAAERILHSDQIAAITERFGLVA